ncbi:HAD family phosphatase [Rhodobacteraceae bacterium RKSG542]|uniref:HAD family hydrolase n=1 Tax=Pseudovibrio flavus TaxID=2529854 RepID=UPI0012BB5D6F|nr:HAD family phosphatase [Pseudovibrio flavus]MTI18499.1 HAD family phosphatase [Pseudovibrio flavus]
MTPELVIFDCDGILVDTETIANRVLSEFIADIGLDFSPSECHARFTGRALDTIQRMLEEMTGKGLGSDWADRVRAADLEAFRAGIEPIDGVRQVVESLIEEGIPYCVGSSGRYEKMHLTLGSAGLLEFFKDVLHSAQDVKEGKPAPDIFLYAARSMGYAPENCVVIEDSIAGMMAARSAGMRCFGYTAHLQGELQDLHDVGAVPFGHMSELPALLGLKEHVS